MAPSRRGFARKLWRLADLVQAAERRRSFRAKAYRQAIWSLDRLDPELDVSQEELLATPGIGPGVAALVTEYRATGTFNQLIPLESALPLDTPRLRRLPRMTPKILHEMKTGLGIETVDDLAAAIETGAATTLPGAGAQTLELWRRILDLRPGPDAVPAHQAWVTAIALANHFEAHTGSRVEVAGAVRRVEEWVDQIDLVAATDDPRGLSVFLTTTAVLAEEVVEEGLVARSRSHAGIRVAIHLAEPEEKADTMTRITGVFPPDGVVSVSDLKGDLHLHSDLSPDGRMSLTTILELARGRGYQYVLISDHTQGLRFGGLDPDGIRAQAEMIDAVRPLFPEIRVFHGAELNIGPDGLLDLPEETLSILDFAVAGVHSYFSLDGDTQTARVLAALTHPVVRVLAHPFGRRIGIRPALDIDMSRVIEAAVEHGVALETNGHRDRLDLGAEWIRIAAKAGAIFAADSDAHRVDEIPNIENAVATLQRAGIPASRVVNTWPLEEFVGWVGGGEGGI